MRGRRRHPAALALMAAALPWLMGTSHMDNYYLIPDVPTDLSGATFLPWQIVRHDEGVYSITLAYSFPDVTPVGTVPDSYHALLGGGRLFSVEAPVTLGGILFQPADVGLLDPGGGFSKRFDAAARGVPAGVNLDALFLDGGDAGDLIVSFDAHSNVGSLSFEPADLVRFDGASFELYFDASAATPPVPPSSNVIGADARGGLTILLFDVPTTLGARTFLPGEPVSWDGAAFDSFHRDPAWPLSSRVEAFSLLARPGVVLPTIEVGSSPFRGRLRISWEASCSAGAEDYAIYEGTLGDWYSHTAIDCSDDGGDMVEDIVPSAGDRYYVVVPINATQEGSYGISSDLSQRPPGAATCAFMQALAACP